MDRLCVRCVRMSLRSRRLDHSACSTVIIRTFSSTRNQPEGSSKNIPSQTDSSAPTHPTRKPIVPRAQQAGASNPRNQGSRPPAEGQLLRRNTSTPPQGNLLRRTGGPPQPGQLLRRRTDQQARPGQFIARGRGGPGQPGQPGKPNQQQLAKRRRRPADRARNVHDDADAPTEAELDEYIVKYIDPPANPTQTIEYQPAPQTALELQKDWPDTPLSSTGLTASLVQKIEFLARRIPHGYQTPEQLAEHFHKGNLTRFESEEEKQKVLQIAKSLAQKRAEQLSKRKGEEIVPLDMSLINLSNNAEDRKLLVNDIVKGDVAEAEKQRMPFLDSIVRNLRNNQTYGNAEMDRFMARVQSVMPASNTNAGANKRPAQKSP